MQTFTKHFTIRGKHAIPSIPLELHEKGWVESSDEIIKSAATKVSEYRIFAHTYDGLNSLCLRSFSLNELEAEFDVQSKELRAITLRDTSVNKKTTFNNKGAILTYVRGQDTVGQYSETNSVTTKEPVSKITINDIVFNIPFEINDVYEKVTGQNPNFLTEEDIEEEARMANTWVEFLEQMKQAQS
ncbi:hypothetical protein 2017DhaAB_0615 [Vibrio phage ICP1]|nr:hypothetical protein 2017DhaAB_0615 [Vibrio phage ICP1]